MLKIQKPLSFHSCCCCNNLAVVVVIRKIVVIHPDLFCEVQLTLTQNVVEMGSKSRVNAPISNQVNFRPCPNQLNKFPQHLFYLYSIYTKSHYFLNLNSYFELFVYKYALIENNRLI